MAVSNNVTSEHNQHSEMHSSFRIGWLRAAVLGANDGIVSTASLIVGVAASDASSNSILIAGLASMFAGAMSMAAGEYVSVSAQSDTENADLVIEARALAEQPVAELEGLAQIYEMRGVDQATAKTVAEQMMAHNALAAHARDELGFSETTKAKPLQAAMTSALTFTAGAAAPIIALLFTPLHLVVPVVALVSLISLMLLGALGARAGGAPVMPSVLRVTFWGVAAMLVTAAVGRLFDVAIA
jgi:vacuolar iron transporter family protein